MLLEPSVLAESDDKQCEEAVEKLGSWYGEDQQVKV